MDQDPDEIRQVIADTREDLAGTIEALGKKAGLLLAKRCCSHLSGRRRG